MGFTTLHILWLVPAFTLTTQELVGLNVSPTVTAECGQQVTLQCSVSSQNGLSIKLMEWSYRKMSLCSVTRDGHISNNTTTFNDFHCEYKKGELSLIFHKVQPLESGNYMCKLQSNKGALHKNTALDLQECGTVKGYLGSHGPVCTFTNVYPDGDVYWFHGSKDLSAGSLKQKTTEREEKGGWLTIESHLEWTGSDGPYNCSLKSRKSGKYIASALVQRKPNSYSVTGGFGSQGPTGTILCISILFAVMLI